MTTGPDPGALPADPPTREPAGGGTSGCLRWSLIGCTLVSAALIVALVVLGMKAKSLLGWALARVEDQVMAGCAPDVTPEERQAFREAFARFAGRAKESKVSPDEIRAFQKKVVEALADGRITPAELRALTAAAGPAGTRPGSP